MGNYKRIYGNGIFVTKLNAKELILKKINADTNWVDIYTSAFVLGEDLNTIGSFMISPEISELISKYSSSLFDPDASFETKIQFIEKNISEADTEEKVRVYTELLERVKIAEELRILGKILKINQGMPTNTADFYEYIGKIEYFVESQLNSKNISEALSFSKSQKQFTEVSDLFIEFLNVINEILNNDTTEESIKKHQNKINSFLKAAKLSSDNFRILREYYQKTKGRLDINAEEYQKLPKQIQDILNINVNKDGKLNFENCTNFVNSLNAIYEFMTLPGKNIDNGHKQIFEKLKSDFWGFVQKCFDSESSYFSWAYDVQESNNKISNKLWANLQESWKKFDLVQFVKNKEYAQSMIFEYENVKVKFNILDTLISLPHFNEMYKVLALNDRVLTVLSKRNKIESEVWRRAIHKKKDKASALMTTPNKSERKILKSLVDDTLIQTWLTTGLTDFYLSSPDGTRLDFDGSLNISKLKSFIETSIIPRLRNNKFIINGQNIDTKSNEFVKRLTFGKHNGESIFKLPFNMSEIDSNPGIKQEYEKILQAFGELRNIHLEGGLTVVDVFYLYNLIVHKDHFGRNSLTRLFEDLISSKDGEKLLVFKFNEWLETVNEQEIVGKVLSSWGASHRTDLSSTENSTQIYISTNPLNKSIPFYSGGANGSDSAWGIYLRQQGFTVKDYTVNDWRALSVEQKGYYDQLYQAAINLLGTEGWPADSYAGELTRRDMMQADSATSIFAIGTLSNSGKVNGGTKYATYAAISQGKPVYLFNLNNNSWYWYDYNSSSFIRMNDKPNLISGAAVIGTRDDKSKTGAEALRASGHEAIKDIIDRSLKLSTPKTRTVKYTPKGQAEQIYTIIGTKIFNKEGDEVYTDENSGHRKLIFVELALQEKRAVKVEYRNVTYIVNDRNQIFSTSSNKIVYENENDGNRRVILEKAKEEFAKLQNSSKMIDINTISTKTEAFDVVFPKQGKTSQALKSEHQQWQIDNPTGIVAYRIKFPYNTIEEVQLGHIGNPFSENARGANTVQQFYDWLVTGNNFGNEKATDEYRRAIISKLLSTPANSPILYYTELNRPSHATVLGYLIANKQLLSNQSSPRVETHQGYWTRAEVASQTDKVFLFGDNTEDRLITHHVPTRTQAVIRGLDNAIGIDTKKNRGTSEGWSRYSTNNYEVSSAGDTRFSAKYARFKDGTIIFGHDVSNRTIESVYQNGIKQGDWTTDSNTKTGIPRSKEIIKGNTEDASYYEGYLPLWQEWAKQNPKLIEELREKATEKTLTDKFAHTRVSQARALSDIIKNGSYFTDADFDIFKAQVDEAIQRAIDSGKTIVIPADGIGTGKAELDKRAPKLFAYLQQKLDELKNLNSASLIQFDDSIDISEESVAEEPVTIGFNNTDERVDNETDVIADVVEEIKEEQDIVLSQTQQNYILANESKLLEILELTVPLPNNPSAEFYNIDLETAQRIRRQIVEFIPKDWEIPDIIDVLGKLESKINEVGEYINKEKLQQKKIAELSKQYQEWKDQSQLLQGQRAYQSVLTNRQMKTLGYLFYILKLAKSKNTSDASLHIDSDYIAEREKILRNAPRNSEGKLLAPNGKVSKLTEEQWVTVRTKAFKEWFGDWTKITKNEDGTWNIPNDVSKVIDTETGEPMVVYHGTQQKFNQFNSEFIFTSNSEPIAAGYAFQLKGISSDVDYAIHDLAIHDKDSALQAIDSKIETEKKIIELGENSPFYEEGDVEKAKESLEKLYNAKKYLEDNEDIFKNLQFRIIEGFSNIKNPLIVNAKGAYWHSIIFENKKITTNQLAKIAKERGYQGVIITDVIDKGTEVITKKDYKDTSDVIILFDPNQIKSATGAHEFTSNPNIYDADPTHVYQTTPSKQSKLIEVVRQANEKGVKGIHIVSQSDLVNEDIYIRSAKGFVRNGEIYINIDRAGDDTVIHEFGHLYLADAKVNNREKYYELLEKVRQTKLWSDMKTWKAYANKIGSDFDEEVLATMIGDYYKSEFGTDYEYTDLVKEALSLVDGGFIDLINSEILPDLGDTFITNYALSQRTATLKHKLVSDNILKENCL